MSEYLGYHGTDNNAAEEIIKKQKFTPSCGLDEWLGQGIYFFQYPDDAQWWCEDNKKLNTFTILQAKISPVVIVDLLGSREDVEGFRKFCDLVKEKSNRLPNGKLRQNYMSLAIKLLVKKADKKIDMIIAAFNENRKAWYNQNRCKELRKFPIIIGQVQYCVLNENCIGDIVRYKVCDENGNERILE